MKSGNPCLGRINDTGAFCSNTKQPILRTVVMIKQILYRIRLAMPFIDQLEPSEGKAVSTTKDPRSDSTRQMTSALLAFTAGRQDLNTIYAFITSTHKTLSIRFN